MFETGDKTGEQQIGVGVTLKIRLDKAQTGYFCLNDICCEYLQVIVVHFFFN